MEQNGKKTYTGEINEWKLTTQTQTQISNQKKKQQPIHRVIYEQYSVPIRIKLTEQKALEY